MSVIPVPIPASTEPVPSGAPGAAHAPIPRIYHARLADLWQFIRRQSAAYWLICIYMMFEYVRPQDIYDSLSGRPLPQWTLIACMVAVLFDRRYARRWTLADGLLACFTVVVIASSFLAWSPETSFADWTHYYPWVLVYILITGIVSTKERLLVFMLLYLLYCMKMTQHGMRGWAGSGFGFIHIGVSCAPTYFRNSGECGMQMAMLFPVSLFFLLALRPYWSRVKFWVAAVALPIGAVITIVASSSRGAVLSLAGIAVWMQVRSGKRLKTLVGVLAMAAVVWAIIPEAQKDRFRTMGDDETSTLRKDYWADGLEILGDNPLLGIGYRNWLPYYQTHYNPAGQLPHNIFIEAGAELGYLGLLAFAALIVGTFVLNARTRRLARRLGAEGRVFAALAHGFDGALIGYLIGGFFVTVLYYPFFWINLAMTVALLLVTEKEQRRLRRIAARTRPAFVGGAGPQVAGHAI